MSILYRKNKSVPFSFVYIITSSKNYLRLSLALASTFAILLMADDIASMLHITLSDGTPAKGVISFFAGYFNHSLIKRLVHTFNKKSNS
jgi:hypothetical protein